jgi:hypothetical protein
MLSSYRVYPLQKAKSRKQSIRLCSLAALEQDTSLNTYVQPTSGRLSTPVPSRMCSTPIIPGILLLSPKAVGDRMSGACIYANLVFLDWNPQTEEDGKKLGLHPWCIHTAARVIAERELWKFSDANPDIDVTSSTFSPSYSSISSLS